MCKIILYSNWKHSWVLTLKKPGLSCVLALCVCVCVCVCVYVFSHVQLSVTPWTVTHQAPLSIEFSRQEYWNGLPFPPPGDLPDSGIKPASLVSLALAGRFFTTVPPGKPHVRDRVSLNSGVGEINSTPWCEEWQNLIGEGRQDGRYLEINYHSYS